MQVEACLKDLTQLTTQHQTVANSTNSLHQVSEQLLADQVGIFLKCVLKLSECCLFYVPLLTLQMKLSSIHSEVERRLQYFRSLDRISQRLASPTLSINSPVFKECLDRLDQCIEYMATHVRNLVLHSFEIYI